MKRILALITILLLAIILFFVYKLATKPDPSSVPSTTQTLTETQTLCFRTTHTATELEPYETSEDVKLNITGTTVFGIKRGTQSGPDMTNGYQGILQGTKNGNMISARFSYVIEGSEQAEDEEYELTETELVKLRYQLVEQNGILIPKKDTEPKRIVYGSISCTEFPQE